MSDDSLYPRTTEYYVADTTDDHQKERDAEKKAIIDELKIIGGVIEAFDASISYLKSIDSLPNDPSVTPDTMCRMVMANKTAAVVLESERDRLIDLVADIEK